MRLCQIAKSLVLLAAIQVQAAEAPTQVISVPRTGPGRGVTTLTLASDVGNGIIAAAPGSRVRVPPNEKVRMKVPDGWSYPVQWTKDGKPIANATGPILEIAATSAADSGFYNTIGAPVPFITTGIDLEVVEPGQIGNFSALVDVVPGRPPPVVGYIVRGRITKQLLVRAIGPGLSQFGIKDGIPNPGLRFFDAAGRELSFLYDLSPVDLAGAYAAAGAFPILAGDAIIYAPFSPGAYTIQVADARGQGGRVLIEVYELPLGQPGDLLVAPAH